VDGQLYVWRANSDSDGGFNITVSSKEGNGQLLTAYVDIVNSGKGVLIITAYIVRQMIVLGLAAGWTPNEKKTALRLNRINERLNLEKATYANNHN